MFRCTVCQKLYNTRVQYCECGNDDFIHIPDNYEPQMFKRESFDYLSWVIFLIFLGLSFWVLFFYNPIKSNHHRPKLESSTEVQSENIPDISKIWNDTPAYKTVQNAGSSIEVYKQSLQNLLNSNISPKQFEGNGRCEIQFSVASNGKLLDRKMIKGEGSNEFNKIVINMLKKTNEHRIPPSDYTGEVFHAEVIVDDGIIKLYIK